MSDLRTAAQQALERLMLHHRTWDARDDLNAITALKVALEQPEQEPVACLVRNRSVRTPARIAADGIDRMGDWSEWKEATLSYGLAVTDPTRNYPQGDCQYEMRHLYTHPPRREWRVLKEWEINDGLDQLPTEDVCSWSFRKGVYFAEKALKERNA